MGENGSMLHFTCRKESLNCVVRRRWRHHFSEGLLFRALPPNHCHFKQAGKLYLFLPLTFLAVVSFCYYPAVLQAAGWKKTFFLFSSFFFFSFFLLLDRGRKSWKQITVVRTVLWKLSASFLCSGQVPLNRVSRWGQIVFREKFSGGTPMRR